jgi:hypothetical protein
MRCDDDDDVSRFFVPHGHAGVCPTDNPCYLVSRLIGYPKNLKVRMRSGPEIINVYVKTSSRAMHLPLRVTPGSGPGCRKDLPLSVPSYSR